MNEQFENNNTEVSEQPCAEQTQPQETAQSQPQTQPQETVWQQTQPQPPIQSSGYPYQPNYNPHMYGAYSNSQQYMPYSAYGKPQKPMAEKKQSKNKKRGAKIAAIIVAVCVVISIAAVPVVLLMGNYVPQQEKIVTNEAQLEFVATPETETTGTMTPGDVYKKVYESSVGILVYSGNSSNLAGEGSGVVMSSGDKTYIITCAHVIEYTKAKIIVQDHNGNQYDATVVGTDSKTDLGVLSVDTDELKAAEFANSDDLNVGDTVFAIGNPGGTQFFGSFTNGMVSAIARPVDSQVGYEVACIQHTAAINPGNSGGALVNAYGQVVGINSSKIAATEYEGMGFAVPTSIVQQIVNQIISEGQVVRPALGITYFFASTNRSYAYYVKENNLAAGAIVISEIREGSGLEGTEAGVGDLIIAVNGKELESSDTLSDAIQSSEIGDKLTLTIIKFYDNDTTAEIEVTAELVADSKFN